MAVNPTKEIESIDTFFIYYFWNESQNPTKEIESFEVDEVPGAFRKVNPTKEIESIASGIMALAQDLFRIQQRKLKAKFYIVG